MTPRHCPGCGDVRFSWSLGGAPERRCWACGRIWTPAASAPRLDAPTVEGGPYRGELAAGEWVLWRCGCEPAHATEGAALACAREEFDRRGRGSRAPSVRLPPSTWRRAS